jgi:uncharacterized protein YrrD
MLRSTNELIGYDVLAEDGQIGSVHDFFYEDQEWVIRYLIVDTGPWILGKKALISVRALAPPDWTSNQFPVTLTTEEIKNSPEIDTDKPVSRQKELRLHEHYGWPIYWSEPRNIGEPLPTAAPQFSEPADEAGVKQEMGKMRPITRDEVGDPHLRSMREVRGYAISGQDGKIGRVDDFIIADEDWIVRYLTIDTGTWIRGKRVAIAPNWIGNISYEDKTVRIDLSKETIKNSPEYDPSDPIKREYENNLYDYYGRPKYWAKDARESAKENE